MERMDNPFNLTPDDIENIRRKANEEWKAGWRPEIRAITNPSEMSIHIQPTTKLSCDDWQTFWANNPEMLQALRQAWVTVPSPAFNRPSEGE